MIFSSLEFYSPGRFSHEPGIWEEEKKRWWQVLASEEREVNKNSPLLASGILERKKGGRWDMGMLGHYLPGCRVMVHFSLGTLEGDWIISSSQAFPASSSGVWRRLRRGHVPPLTRWGRGPNGMRVIGPALASGTRGRRPRFGHIDRQPEEGCGRAHASQPGRTTRPWWSCSARVFCRRH